MVKNGIWSEFFFVKLIYLISRVFLAWAFFNFLAHSAIYGIEINFFFEADTQKWRFVKKEFFIKEIVEKFPIKGIVNGFDQGSFNNWVGTIDEVKAKYMYDQFFAYFDSIGMPRDFLTTKFSKGPIKAKTTQFDYADTDFIQTKCRQFYKHSIIDCSVQ